MKAIGSKLKQRIKHHQELEKEKIEEDEHTFDIMLKHMGEVAIVRSKSLGGLESRKDLGRRRCGYMDKVYWKPDATDQESPLDMGPRKSKTEED